MAEAMSGLFEGEYNIPKKLVLIPIALFAFFAALQITGAVGIVATYEGSVNITQDLYLGGNLLSPNSTLTIGTLNASLVLGSLENATFPPSSCAGTDKAISIGADGKLTCGSDLGIRSVSLPLGNLTGSTSGQCTGTDKVVNVTVTNGILTASCDSDVTGTSSGVSGIPQANLTGLTLPASNITGIGVSGIPQANLTGISLPAGNITGIGVSGIPQANLTGISIPLTNTTGSQSDKCAGTDKVTNVTITNGVVNVECDTDVSGSSGTLFASPWLYNESSTGYFNDTYANLTYDTRYKAIGAGTSGLSLGINVTWSGLTNIAQANLTGITLPASNVTGIGVSGIPQANLTGITLPSANITGIGVSGIPQSNLTGISLPASNVTGIGVSGIPQANLTGITLPSYNVTGTNLTNLLLGVNVTWSGLTNIAQANLTGLTLPAANITGIGVSGIPQGNLTGLTLPSANVTGINLSSLQLGVNITWTGLTNIAQANLTGISLPSSNISAGTFPAGQFNIANLNVTTQLNVSGINCAPGFVATLTAGVLSCVQDQLGEPGSGSLFSSPWLYNTSSVGYFNDTYANETYDTRYKAIGAGTSSLALGINVTWTGLTNIAQANLTGITLPASNVTGIGVNGIPQANLTGLTLPSGNITGTNLTNLALGVNVTWTGLTGLALGTNVTWSGLNNIAQANLTGITLPAQNITGTNLTNLALGVNVTWTGLTGISQANLTGITIPFYNVTHFNVTGLDGNNITSLAWTKISAFPGLTSLALGTNVTWTGLTGLALGVNVTWTGLTNIAQANLTGLTIPFYNITNFNVSRIAQANLTGITIPSANVTGTNLTNLALGVNVTWTGLTGISQANLTGITLPFYNITYFNVTGIAQANLTGISIPSGNVTSGSFATGQYKFQDKLNVTGNMSITPTATNNNTFQLYYDSAGACQTKTGWNGTHYIIASC